MVYFAHTDKSNLNAFSLNNIDYTDIKIIQKLKVQKSVNDNNCDTLTLTAGIEMR
jgi:hypothetical protein